MAVPPAGVGIVAITDSSSDEAEQGSRPPGSSTIRGQGATEPIEEESSETTELEESDKAAYEPTEVVESDAAAYEMDEQLLRQEVTDVEMPAASSHQAAASSHQAAASAQQASNAPLLRFWRE